MMVDKERDSILLSEMRKTPGYAIFLEEMHAEYLRRVRTLVAGSVSTVEDVVKARTAISMVRICLELTGMSKEELNKWMEIR